MPFCRKDASNGYFSGCKYHIIVGKQAKQNSEAFILFINMTFASQCNPVWLQIYGSWKKFPLKPGIRFRQDRIFVKKKNIIIENKTLLHGLSNLHFWKSHWCYFALDFEVLVS